MVAQGFGNASGAIVRGTTAYAEVDSFCPPFNSFFDLQTGTLGRGEQWVSLFRLEQDQTGSFGKLYIGCFSFRVISKMGFQRSAEGVDRAYHNHFEIYVSANGIKETIPTV